MNEWEKKEGSFARRSLVACSPLARSLPLLLLLLLLLVLVRQLMRCLLSPPATISPLD